MAAQEPTGNLSGRAWKIGGTCPLCMENELFCLLADFKYQGAKLKGTRNCASCEKMVAQAPGEGLRFRGEAFSRAKNQCVLFNLHGKESRYLNSDKRTLQGIQFSVLPAKFRRRAPTGRRSIPGWNRDRCGGVGSTPRPGQAPAEGDAEH